MKCSPSPLPSQAARRGTRRWIALLLAAASAVAGCDRGEDGDVAVGTLERDRVELVAEAQEPIVEIAVLEGHAVSAGDVVLRFDERRMKAEVARAEGARNRAVARLAELERGPRRELIDEAKAAVAGAVGILDRERRALERARTLYQQGVGSEADRDAAKAAFDNSTARRDAAVAELHALEAGTTPEEVDQARAAVSEAQGALEAARIRHERMTVRAPIDGRIDAIPFKLGAQPPPGAAVAVMLADTMPYARVYVPEPIRARVKPGQAATVAVDGIAEPFAARVRTVARDPAFTPFFALTESDRGRLTYLAELDLLGPEAGELPSGVPVEAHFDLVGADG